MASTNNGGEGRTYTVQGMNALAFGQTGLTFTIGVTFSSIEFP
jgi:hypothetical protein